MISITHTGNLFLDTCLSIMYFFLVSYPILGGFVWFIGVWCYVFFSKLVDCLEKCLIYGHIRRFAN
ncbi:TPA: hypothetical protein LQC04_000097 [Enterococcus faecium]|nr:hypothetical protein [Enterococcus faecium]